ncbi:hypothetical protein RJ640_027386 [Escallonia rubra]|uniref:Uncharacterized protein n=1 Tax=Escallonia rubra TaxID=112253 RepID=A0AA88UUW1_9ASTE|nr:hypothetical protein RJ640_027386 [Escallonia rubra]
MEAEPKKRRRFRAPPRRVAPTSVRKEDTAETAVHVAQRSGVHPAVQQARDFAVAQAQQEGCTGNFKSFDSPFGNFLLPVIPTRAELGG